MGDLADAVGLGAGNRRGLAAEVQVGPMLLEVCHRGESLPPASVRLPAFCGGTEDRRVAHRHDVFDAGIVGEDAFEPFELLARDLRDDAALGAGALLEDVQGREQRVLVDEPEGRAPHPKRAVERHAEILLKLAFERADELGLLLGPGSPADLVVAGHGVELQPVILHPLHPGAVVGLRELLDGVLVRPVTHDQIARDQDELGALRP